MGDFETNLDGVIKLRLNDIDIEMKITHKVILNTERDLQESITLLCGRIRAGVYSLKDVATLLTHAVYASDAVNAKAVTFDKMSEQIYKHGLLNDDLMDVLATIALIILSGGKINSTQKKTEEHPLITP